MKKENKPKDDLLNRMLSHNEFGTYFGISQAVLDKVWGNLTAPDGNSAIYISMEIGADLDVFNPIKKTLQAMETVESDDARIQEFINRFLNGPEKIPNYGGGLGILAGDTLKSFADCQIPVAAVSLLYRKGYFSQLVDSKVGQIVWTREWEPEKTPGLYLLKNPQHPEKPLEIEIPFYDESDEVLMAYAQIWLKIETNSNLDSFVPELLLDYSIPSSPAWIRDAAYSLYDSSSERTRALQRRMLGAGLLPLMARLGLTARTIHLNEQHGVVAILHLIVNALINKFGPQFGHLATDRDIINAANEVAKGVAFTIHTPVKAGHDRFNKTLYAGLSHASCLKILNVLARDDEYPNSYNFTAMAMQVNRSTNSVSRLHRDVTKKQFPQFAKKITAITNGVHHLTWISDARAEVFNSFPELANWVSDPGVFAKTASLRKSKKFRDALDHAWQKDTTTLINYVNDMLNSHRKQMQETWIDPPNYLSLLENERPLDPAVFTLGFARRFSTYKRADLIFDDIDALAEIVVSNNWPINFLFAGKAHPADEPGKSVIKVILDLQKELYHKSNGLAKLIFIPGYDMKIAKLMVAGVHAWLNSPKRPLEASGTSGMKAAMNAVPNISIMDGWWVEGYHDGLTGWKFGYEKAVEEECLSENPDALLYAEDSDSFYLLLPEILKTFYDPKLRQHYFEKSLMNLVLNVPIFNTHRMVAEYTPKYNLTLPPAIDDKIKRFQKLYQSEI